jgi:prepilin-type processing-associated H-X9-DG protein
VEKCATNIHLGEQTDCHYYSNVFIAILPFLEQDNLFKTYVDFPNPNLEAVARKNEAFCQTNVPIYNCPSDPRAGQVIAPWTIPPDGAGQPTPPLLYMASSYKAMTGIGNDCTTNTFGGFWFEVIDAGNGYQRPGQQGCGHPSGKGLFHGDGASGLKPERMANITDGTSNTIIVGERHTRPGWTPAGRSNNPAEAYARGPFWADSFNLYTKGAAYRSSATLLEDYVACSQAIDPTGTSDNRCKYGWGSFHPGTLNWLFADGSVHGLSRNIDMQIFQALSTIAGGEVIPNF